RNVLPRWKSATGSAWTDDASVAAAMRAEAPIISAWRIDPTSRAQLLSSPLARGRRWELISRLTYPVRDAAPSSRARYLSRRGAKLPAFSLEHVVEAPLGKFDTGREPEIPRLLHVLDDATQRQGAAGTADDVRMHGEGNVFGRSGRLRIELVEIRLPRLQPVIRVAVFAMAMAEQRAVSERLARKLDQQLAVLFPEEWQLLMKAVGVEDEAVLDQKLDGVRALGARAPAVRAASRPLLDHGDRLLHHLGFVVARQVARDLVVVSVPFHHMTVGKDRLDRFGETLRDGPAGQERRLDVLFLQNPQQPINGMMRAVFALAPHLVILDAVLIRLHVFAALEIEGQKNRGSLSARPTDEMVVVIFLKHGSIPLR